MHFSRHTSEQDHSEIPLRALQTLRARHASPSESSDFWEELGKTAPREASNQPVGDPDAPSEEEEEKDKPHRADLAQEPDGRAEKKRSALIKTVEADVKAVFHSNDEGPGKKHANGRGEERGRQGDTTLKKEDQRQVF